nr:acyl-CoA dehydrogenase family protein [Alphaproteobacteria bacterium]
MDSALTSSEQRMIDAAADFAAGVIAPNAAAWEQQRCLPPEGIRPAAQAGLTGLLLTEAEGGHGLSKTAMARVMEELSMADMAYAFVLVVHNNFMNAIAQAGSQAQRERYLPDMLSGECLGAFLLTEPQSGSDAANVTTTARRDGGDWVLNGAKAWITSAASADLLSVYAQTDAARGWRGIAAFLVEADQPGVIREAPYSTMGAHVMGTGGFRFADCRIPD